MHVDLMAFGSIESPQGTVTPPFREADPLDVFGMTQVYATVDAVRFGGGPEIRLPTVAGYVALKLKAWIDRSAVYNEKDAPDLGLAPRTQPSIASTTSRGAHGDDDPCPPSGGSGPPTAGWYRAGVVPVARRPGMNVE